MILFSTTFNCTAHKKNERCHNSSTDCDEYLSDHFVSTGHNHLVGKSINAGVGYLFQTGGSIGLLMWREWMNALCALRCWLVTSWSPATVHMRLKQVEVLRREILSGIKWSVWQEAHSIGVDCCWWGSEWSCWYKCRWYDVVHAGVPVIMKVIDLMPEREMLMVSGY